MKKQALFAISLVALVIPSAPALADPPPWAPAHGKRAKDHDHHYRDYRDDRRSYSPRTLRRGDYVWRGNDGHYYCKRSDGTTGLIVGLAAGALLGRAIDTRGDRATGTILGAAGGGLLGKAIDSGDIKCR